MKVRQDEFENVEDSEDIERLVPEIGMLKFVLLLVRRKYEREKKNTGLSE